MKRGAWHFTFMYFGASIFPATSHHLHHVKDVSILLLALDLQVTELNVILDSSFVFDVQGYLTPILDYTQQDPSLAYSPTCSEVFSRISPQLNIFPTNS